MFIHLAVAARLVHYHYSSVLNTYGDKVETWKFKATEPADRVQMIIYWLMACGRKF